MKNFSFRVLPHFFVSSLAALLFVSCAEQEIVNTPPSTYELRQNYPNPFSDTTVVEYGVPYVGPGGAAPWIRLSVYNRARQKQVGLVENGAHPAGRFKVTWSGRGINGIKVPPGAYYVELQQVNARASGTSFVEEVYVLQRIVALKN